jgi:hypothetical protein
MPMPNLCCPEISKTYDFLDVARAAEAFLNGIPAASVYALLEGFKQAGT